MADCPNCEATAKQNEKLKVAFIVAVKYRHELEHFRYKFEDCSADSCKQAREALEGK